MHKHNPLYLDQSRELKNMKPKIIFLSTLFLFNSPFAAASEETDDPMHGENVHNEHCYKCHTDSVYTREERFVKSIDALGKQVVRCKDSNDIPWFDEDTDAVVQFLNQKYYKF
jgi:hypothetical protein